MRYNLLAAAAFAAAAPLLGQVASVTRPAATRPTTAVAMADCVSSECHANVKSSPVVHGPVGTNNCDTCHELTNAAKHTFKATRQKAELCTYCHEFSVKQMPVIHSPVAQGECLGCHDPHGGRNQSMTRENSTPELCGRCHESVSRNKNFLHGPVSQGACDSCHPPHASRFPKLLDVVGSDLCLTCHKELERPIAAAKFRHKALEKGCDSCHEAHGSNAPMSLKQGMPDLCMSCHEQLKEKIASAKVQHTALTRERLCMNCHNPHASNVGKLMSDLPVVACLKCHQKPIKTDRGYTVAGVGEVVNPKLHKHGEIKDGLCAGCHEVHGAKERNLLVRPYTREFYQRFAKEDYALCFGCHDPQLVEAAKTTKATGFRNGEHNLHNVHANMGEHDRSCRVCHTSHAAANDRIIRETFRFGRWDMPVRFSKTATGGTCAPGCHGIFPYDREQPVARPATAAAATSRPAAVLSREDIRMIVWEAKDTAGSSVKIPDPAWQATVIVLLKSDDVNNPETLERIHELKLPAKARVVTVLCGKKPQESVNTATTNPSWPVVLDSGAAAEALEVRGWPVGLVLDQQGREIARLSSEGEFLARRLSAYVDLATGQIDKGTLTTRLTTVPLVETEPAKQMTRDLRVARVLVEDGKAQQALAFIARNSSRFANQPEVQALKAEALLQLNRSAEASLVIEQLPAGVIAPERITLLKAHVMIQQDRWYMAQPLLEELVKSHPEMADAHLLLGKCYEQGQDWPKAAEQYRLGSEAKKKR